MCATAIERSDGKAALQTSVSSLDKQAYAGNQGPSRRGKERSPTSIIPYAIKALSERKGGGKRERERELLKSSIRKANIRI